MIGRLFVVAGLVWCISVFLRWVWNAAIDRQLQRARRDHYYGVSHAL
jgi:hypothetical protein